MKNRIIISALSMLVATSLCAEKVEVSSDTMKAQEQKREVHFTGHVYIRQAESWLRGDKVIVHFTKDNKTDRYDAIGNVTFELKDERGHYKGKAKSVVYYPPKSKYILKGKAEIVDMINNRQLQGSEIVLDMKTGNASVKGGKKKPVKFIFDMEKK